MRLGQRFEVLQPYSNLQFLAFFFQSFSAARMESSLFDSVGFQRKPESHRIRLLNSALFFNIIAYRK